MAQRVRRGWAVMGEFDQSRIFYRVGQRLARPRCARTLGANIAFWESPRLLMKNTQKCTENMFVATTPKKVSL